MRIPGSTPSPCPLPHEGEREALRTRDTLALEGERGALRTRETLGTLSPLGRGQGEGGRAR
jgi:hypothetical protein